MATQEQIKQYIEHLAANPQELALLLVQAAFEKSRPEPPGILIGGVPLLQLPEPLVRMSMQRVLPPEQGSAVLPAAFFNDYGLAHSFGELYKPFADDVSTFDIVTGRANRGLAECPGLQDYHIPYQKYAKALGTGLLQYIRGTMKDNPDVSAALLSTAMAMDSQDGAHLARVFNTALARHNAELPPLAVNNVGSIGASVYIQGFARSFHKAAITFHQTKKCQLQMPALYEQAQALLQNQLSPHQISNVQQFQANLTSARESMAQIEREYARLDPNWMRENNVEPRYRKQLEDAMSYYRYAEALLSGSPAAKRLADNVAANHQQAAKELRFNWETTSFMDGTQSRDAYTRALSAMAAEPMRALANRLDTDALEEPNTMMARNLDDATRFRPSVAGQKPAHHNSAKAQKEHDKRWGLVPHPSANKADDDDASAASAAASNHHRPGKNR